MPQDKKKKDRTTGILDMLSNAVPDSFSEAKDIVMDEGAYSPEAMAKTKRELNPKQARPSQADTMNYTLPEDFLDDKKKKRK